jgi:hypothetical protein
MLVKSVLLIAFILLVNQERSLAATIVSNLTDPVDGAGTIYASGPPQDYAQEFTTGSQSAQLGSIIADLGPTSGTFTAFAELVADNGGLPGSSVLTSFIVPAIPTSSPSDVTFAPNSSIILSANTNYWFVLSATGTGSYKWQYTDTLSSSLPNYAYSHDGVNWTTGEGGPFLIEVDSTPEPSSLGLIGLAGLLGFVWISRSLL